MYSCQNDICGAILSRYQGWIYWKGGVWGGGAGGVCYFHDKAEKYERHNEILYTL